ncbi:protein transport protein sec24-like at3g07100, partial [Phtheirospermum japonicum]
GSDVIKRRLPLTAENLDSRGLYILDDSFRFVIWFGGSISPDIGRNLRGDDFSGDYSKVSLSPRDHEMSRRLMKILSKLRERDPSYFQLCHLVRQGEQPREGFFLLMNLVDDQNGGANSYADWILQLHRQVQQNA